MSRRTKVSILIQKTSGKNSRSDERSPAPARNYVQFTGLATKPVRFRAGEAQKTKILGLRRQGFC
jgi:hypothetical protein